jgi:hypothetical protein
VKLRYGFSVDEEGGSQAHTSLESAQRLTWQRLTAMWSSTPMRTSMKVLKRRGVSPSGIRWALQRLGMTYKEKSTSSQSGSRKAVYVLPKDQPSYKKKEKQLLTSMRVDLLIACHALSRYSRQRDRCFGTHDGGAKDRAKKGRTNVMGELLGKALIPVSLFQST